jgi:hypothetical protein
MQSATASRKPKGSGRIRGLIVLFVGLLVCYVLSQSAVVEEVCTRTGDFDTFQNAVPVRVTTWVSISMFGRPIGAPVWIRSDTINPNFE